MHTLLSISYGVKMPKLGIACNFTTSVSVFKDGEFIFWKFNENEVYAYKQFCSYCREMRILKVSGFSLWNGEKTLKYWIFVPQRNSRSFFALLVVFRMVSGYANVFPDISFHYLANRNNSPGIEGAFT